MSYGPTCPTPVERAVMVQWWDDLAFLHWRYEPAVVQRLLPQGLTVETCDGSAWVSLVPFWMRVALARGPSVPWMSRFAETNVRTYVTAPGGAPGIWFFSLDAARLGAVLTGRWTYRLPYCWARMRVAHAGAQWSYASRRRWPGPRGATSRVDVEVGEPYAPGELTPLDHFLTARWTLFAAPRRGLSLARAEHDAWPLYRTTVLRCDDELVPAAGLPAPTVPPLAHWSPSVRVRLGLPASVAVTALR